MHEQLNLFEEWRPVPGYEGYYEVSDLGHVRRLKQASGTQTERILKLLPQGHKGEYQSVVLSRHSQIKSFPVHRLVALAFIGPLPRRHEINHKNGIKTDNRPANLEYVTKSENQLHALRTGLRVNYRDPVTGRFLSKPS